MAVWQNWTECSFNQTFKLVLRLHASYTLPSLALAQEWSFYTNNKNEKKQAKINNWMFNWIEQLQIIVSITNIVQLIHISLSETNKNILDFYSS